jgi:regulator of replication initiation timing
MSKTTAEIVALLKELSADMAEMKVSMTEMKAAMTNLHEDNASSAINGEKMYKTLNAKFDIFKNLEAQSREAIQQTAAAPRKLTRPGFFKKLFLEDREKYMNILYTQEEIDFAFQDKDVIAKKKDADRLNKVAGIIFTNYIKADNPEGRASAFASLYE